MNAPPLRLIVVGCGQVFERYHLPAIRSCDAVRLVGLCDADASRRSWMDAAGSGARSASSVEELLRSVEADAALISTPPDTHAALVETALHANLAVLVEKPMTVTLDQAKRVCELERRAGRVVRVGFNRRYRTDYARLRARTVPPGGPGGVEQVAFTFIADARRWKVNPAAATPGFVLHDAGSHAVDLVAHVGGAPIARLRARETDGGGQLTVTIDAVLRNGATATCTVGHGSRYREHLTVTAAGRVHRVSDAAGPVQQAQSALRKITGRPTPAQESFRAQLAGFVSACRADPDGIGADAAAGLAAVSAIDSALLSLADGGAWHDLIT